MSKSNAVKIAVLSVVLGAAAYFALHQRQARPVAIGDRAPEFSVPALSSGSLDLKNYRGKIVVVHFWATWCPPCVEEAPALEKFAEKMQDRGVVVLGVSVDENLNALQEFTEQNHITYPIGRDPNRAVATRYGTLQFPESYILDRGGLVAEKVPGPTDWGDPRMQNFVLDLTGASGR